MENSSNTSFSYTGVYELFLKKISRSLSVTSFFLVVAYFLLIINGVVAFYARRKRTNAPSFLRREGERERVLFFSVVRFVISDLVLL